MARPGRNDQCPCGSGRKVKRCCGEQRGPSEEQLARAELARLARAAVADLAGLDSDELDVLFESDDLFDLPALDVSLLVTLPKLITPDLQRLREAIERDDPDWGWDALTAVAAAIDTPPQRARLAGALARLRGAGRVDPELAAAAIFGLHSGSTRFLGASLLQAVALSVGAERTPGGLLLACERDLQRHLAA